MGQNETQFRKRNLKLKPKPRIENQTHLLLWYSKPSPSNRIHYPLNKTIQSTVDQIKSEGNILVFYSEDYGNDFAIVYAQKGAVIEQGELATCYTLPIYGVAQCLIDGSILWRCEGLTWLEAIEKQAEAMKGHIGYYE